MSTTKQDTLTLQAVPQCIGIRESQSRSIHHHKFCKSTVKCVEDVNMYMTLPHSLILRPHFWCMSCASLVPRPTHESLGMRLILCLGHGKIGHVH